MSRFGKPLKRKSFAGCDLQQHVVPPGRSRRHSWLLPFFRLAPFLHPRHSALDPARLKEDRTHEWRAAVRWPHSRRATTAMLTSDTFTRLCRARDMLREVHHRPVTLDAVAREATMSPFHFIRQFRAVFGETPHQSRIRAQLDRAKHLLALEEASVTDVCMEVGFSSLGSFSDLFERRVGVRPSNYRRRARTLTVVPGTMPTELFPGCLNLMVRAFATFKKR